MRGRLWVARIFALSIVGSGCGPSQEEFDEAQNRVAGLRADLDEANRRHAADEERYADAEREVDFLKSRLQELTNLQANDEADLRDRLAACQSQPAPVCPTAGRR